MVKKPTSPAGHFVFPKEGSPFIVIEELPDDATELEAHITLAFATALRQQGMSVSVGPRPAGDWPDARLDVDGVAIGVELVEVVDAGHRRQVMSRPWYTDQLRAGISSRGLHVVIGGMDLHLSDRYRGLPPRGSPSAQRLIEGVLNELENRRDALEASPPNILAVVDFDDGPWALSVYGWRVSQAGPDYVLRWDEAHMVDPLWLRRTVERKVRKGYSGRGGHDRLWLVAWDSHGYLLGSDKDSVKELLEEAKHPIDALWSCYLGGGSTVIVEKIWEPGRPPP